MNTPIYSRSDCTRIGRAIENDIHKEFGWVVKVTIRQNGSFTWRAVSGKDRYDLYPGMSKQQADDAIMKDIEAIFQNHMPDAYLTDYMQSGAMHYPRRG